MAVRHTTHVTSRGYATIGGYGHFIIAIVFFFPPTVTLSNLNSLKILTFVVHNEYLERLTRAGPKRLHILYKYIVLKVNAYSTNARNLISHYTSSLT